MSWRSFLFFFLMAHVGCRGEPYTVAPVSGKVTLDGKPLVNAWVNFVPMGTKENSNPGKSSHADTDSEGKYLLKIDPKHPGAVVGRNKVYIGTLGQSDTSKRGPPGREEPDVPNPKTPTKDRVPMKYNLDTTLEFDVPAGGTDKADFDLKSR